MPLDSCKSIQASCERSHSTGIFIGIKFLSFSLLLWCWRITIRFCWRIEISLDLHLRKVKWRKFGWSWLKRGRSWRKQTINTQIPGLWSHTPARIPQFKFCTFFTRSFTRHRKIQFNSESNPFFVIRRNCKESLNERNQDCANFPCSHFVLALALRDELLDSIERCQTMLGNFYEVKWASWQMHINHRVLADI